MIDGPNLRHEFVEYIPSVLEDRTIYISIPFATAAHKCACGCGHEVVTPLSPTDWKLIFDGESVSLEPSIGNWGFPCRSHYWITRNNVRWAYQMSQWEIEAGRRQDRVAKERYFNENPEAQRRRVKAEPAEARSGGSFWQKLKNWLIGGRRD